MNKFFLVCPVGLEGQLESELRDKFPLYFPSSHFELIKKDFGGLEIECELPHGLLLNQILRSPSKILMRLKTQKCRDLPKFYNIIKKIPWRDYLNQESVDVSITAKKSRIIHTTKLENSFHKALSDYFTANKLKNTLVEKHALDPKQKIFIRLDNDDLTISLDTSGDLLHIRGDRSFRGHASLRENIATLLLIKLMNDLPPGQYNLVDPMCGSGTFLYEWLKRDSLQQRSFNYEYLSDQQLKTLPEVNELQHEDNFSYFGFDIDAEIIEQLKLDPAITFKVQDIKTASPLNGPNILMVNPPYGKRVKIAGDKQKYFQDLIQDIKRAYRPKRLGIIIPREFVGRIAGDKTYFNQNGIDVCLIIQKEKI